MEDLTITLTAKEAQQIKDTQILLTRLLRVRKAGKGKVPTKYTLDEAKYQTAFTIDPAPFRGQTHLVIQSSRELGPEKSIKEIFQNCKETLETAKPKTANAVGQIIKKLHKAGIMNVLNPSPTKKKGTK